MKTIITKQFTEILLAINSSRIPFLYNKGYIICKAWDVYVWPNSRDMEPQNSGVSYRKWFGDKVFFSNYTNQWSRGFYCYLLECRKNLLWKIDAW